MEILFPILLLTVCLVGRAGAVKIYINPSDQTRNVSPDGTYNEAAAMKDVAQRLEAKLNAQGFEVRNSDGGTMREALRMTLPGLYALQSSKSGGQLTKISYPWE